MEIRSGVFGRLKSTRSFNFKRIEPSHIRTRSAFHYGHKVSPIADAKCHPSRRGHSTFSGMLDASESGGGAIDIERIDVGKCSVLRK